MKRLMYSQALRPRKIKLPTWESVLCQNNVIVLKNIKYTKFLDVRK